jgi:hypothetical protein
MTEDVIIVPIVFGLPTIAVIVRMLLRHREKMAELDRNSTPSTSMLEERLTRVENALDSIAIEMERVGEGQRFLTKVFTQRGPAGELPASPPTPASAPRTITPH